MAIVVVSCSSLFAQDEISTGADMESPVLQHVHGVSASFDVQSVPEPSAVLLGGFAFGLIVLGRTAFHRRQNPKT